MIGRYKDNQQKYEELLDYIENHSNMSEELKNDILNTIKRYKTLVFCLEQQEVYDLIDKSIEKDNKRILEKELHSMISGKVVDHDAGVYEAEHDDYRGKRKENIYNLD